NVAAAWLAAAPWLVVVRTIPGLARCYGGMVRAKNMLSVLMQVLVVFALVVVLWTVYGYSLAFGGDGLFYGDFSKLFLAGVGADATAATFSKGVVLPELRFVAFQATLRGT